jgi:hypothetical protein
MGRARYTAMTEVVQPAKGISEVLQEVREIRQLRDTHVAAGTLNLFDEDACERYLREVVHKGHRDFAQTYPVLARDVIHNQLFAMRAVKKYFKWLSNTPDPRKAESENLFYRRQAEYMYFAARQQTVGKMKARKSADDCYDALVADDAKVHEHVDGAVDKMHDRNAAAQKRVIARLQKRARLMALALSGAEAPAAAAPADAPATAAPAETTPAETTPAETTPAETTPAEAPAETTPAETTPAEAPAEAALASVTDELAAAAKADSPVAGAPAK